MEQVDFAGLLASQGLTGPQRAAAIGSIVGRMAAPASERATHTWLGERSGLGELLDVDYEAMGLSALYRASDRLLTHKTALEAALFQRRTPQHERALRAPDRRPRHGPGAGHRLEDARP